ncbi:MAG: aminoglycoside phosphotransferase family protein [Gemmataceae bacterium]|nr:aminoglycoside phosphotransferase family protein [Gemmataceae bacterium]
MAKSRRLDPTPVLAALGFPTALITSTHFGFSDAVVWHAGPGALKAYPPDWGGVALLRLIHSRLTQAVGLLPRPLAPPWEDQGRVWDFVEWRPGQSLADEREPDVWRSVGEALARLHRSWWPQRTTAEVAPCVLRHWQALAEFDGPDAAYGVPLGLLVERARAQIKPWLNRACPVQPVHGDLWAGNVLAEAGRVSGFIDHGSIRIDAPVADLARLGESHRADVLAGYESESAIPLADADLLAALVVSGPVVRLLRWLAWQREGRAFPDVAAAGRRFESVVAQARQLLTV